MGRALAVLHGRFGRVTHYDLDRGYITHAHREAQLVFHVNGQAARINVNKDPVPLAPECGVATNSWEPHDYDPPPRYDGQQSLTLYIRPSWYEAYDGPASGPLLFGRREVEVTDPVRRVIERMLGLMRTDTSPSLFEGLVFELTKTVCDQTNGRGTAASAPWTVSDFRVRKAMTLLADYRGSDVDLGFVARHAGMSRPNFFRLFKSQTGLTPKLYYNTIRMERALHDLSRTHKPVTEISLDLGFASQSSFSRFFTLNCGMSPSDYRSAIRVLS